MLRRYRNHQHTGIFVFVGGLFIVIMFFTFVYYLEINIIWKSEYILELKEREDGRRYVCCIGVWSPGWTRNQNKRGGCAAGREAECFGRWSRGMLGLRGRRPRAYHPASHLRDNTDNW